MADTTNIEWADATANFWIGCTKVSAACDHCYAEADWDHRKHRVKWGPHGDRSYCKAGAGVIRKMQRGAASFIAKHGRKPRVFINSLSDVMDNHASIKPEWRAEIWQLARECPDVFFMLVTKRPQNFARFLPGDWGAGYPNVWLLVTAEDQPEADRRVTILLATPAAIRGVSYEPALGPVDWSNIAAGKNSVIDSLTGIATMMGGVSAQTYKLDLIIAGGESGPKARPAHPNWFRQTRDQCAASGTAYFFKQWGEWHPSGNFGLFEPKARDRHIINGIGMARIGKKRAGNVLDGRQYLEMPA